MMNAKNLPSAFRFPLCFTVLYSILAWCSGIAASDDFLRPYVPPHEVPAILRSTPEEVAREILIGVMPGFMDFPEGKVAAEWIEFQNSEKVEPAYKSLLTRHSPERLMKVFPTFDPAFDSLRVSPKTGRQVVFSGYNRVYKLRFPPGADIGAICEKLKSLPGIWFAEPNQIVTLEATPNDPYFRGTTLPGPQWNLDRIKAPDAWDLTRGRSSTVIAIVEGGIHWSHPEFTGKITGDREILLAGRGYWHGSAVASVAAANTNNGIGIAGVDWHATLLSRAWDSWTADAAANEIWGAALADADIINCSFSFPNGSDLLRRLTGDAYENGSAIVAAIGNDNLHTLRYPAAYPQPMLSVGATDATDARGVWTVGEETFGSNWGSHIDVAAPGIGIPFVSYDPDNFGYSRDSGTSLAAPHVSGVAGLMLAYYKELFNEDLTNEDIYEIIKRSAKDIHGAGFDNTSGHGLLDAKNALDMLTPPYALLHGSTSGVDAGNTGSKITMVMNDIPGLVGTYYVNRHEVGQTVSFGVTFASPPNVWGNPSTIGYTEYNPNYGLPWSGPVPGFTTTTGCKVRTYVYEVFTVSGDRVGWFPSAPSGARIDYTVHGTLANALVNGNMEEVSISGTDTTLASWTATGPWAQDNTYRSRNGIPEVGRVSTHSAGSYDPQTGTGTLTSGTFLIHKPYINLRVCGYDSSDSGQQNKVDLQVLDGSWKTKRRTFAPGTNDFTRYTWDVSAFQDLEAKIVCTDANADSVGAWIGVDGIAQSTAYVTTLSGYVPPDAPTNVTATAGHAQVRLSWTNPNDATISKYQYRQSTNGGSSWSPDWTDISGSSASTTSHTRTGLTNGTRYTFQVRAVNAGGAAGPESASVQARPVRANNRPVAASDVATTNEDAAVVINVLTNDSDRDRDALTVTSVTSPSSGTATVRSDNRITYTPNTNFNGNDQFSYTVSDGYGGSATAQVRVTVNAVNDSPVAMGSIDAQTVMVGGAAAEVDVSSKFKDPDGDDLTYTATTSAASIATTSVSESTVSISPVSAGSATITVTASDGSLTATQTIAVTVEPPTAPTAPTAPTVAATEGNAQVALSWANLNNATITKYQYRQSTNGGSSWSPDWTDISGSSASTTSHTRTGLTNGTTYTFQVRAVNAGGAGAASASVHATPTAPPVPCDFNGDGVVNDTDFQLFSAEYQAAQAGSSFDARMDLNHDGTINFYDFIIFATHYTG